MFSSSKKPKWNADKCKVNLKMLVNRFQLLTQKKANLAKQQKRQVALLLRDDKEANARILVEHIIREDYTLESYELLKQYTEQLIARFNVLVTEADLRPEIGEAVNSILYSGWLMGSDVPELKELNMLFTAKYGVPYAQEVVANKENYLNQRLLRMLTSTQVPDPTVIELYLTEIAKAYSVEWKPRPAETVMHVSSTIGVPVPLPGMPVANEQTPPQLIPPLGPTPAENPVYATAVPVPTASSSHHAPTTSVPPSVPPAMINFDTLMPSPDAAEEYTASMLMGPQGFGMALDSDNVVLTVRPDSEAARCGLVQVGDRVLAVNETEVSSSRPVKSVTIDLSDGDIAHFRMRRARTSSTTNQAPQAASPVPTPLPPTPPTAAYLELPPSGPVNGAMPAAPLAPVNGAMAAAPLGATAAPTPTTSAEDDLLLRRLEMLKRS